MKIGLVGGGFGGMSAVASILEAIPHAELTVITPGNLGESLAFDSGGRLSGLINTDVTTFALGSVPLGRALRNLAKEDTNFCERRHVGTLLRSFAGGLDAHQVTHVRDTVRRVVAENTAVNVDTTSDSEFVFDELFMARGYSRPKIPSRWESYAARSNHLVIDPYGPDFYEKTTGDVLIVGTGPTAIDAALSICSRGHTCTLISRNGLLPSVKTATPRLMYLRQALKREFVRGPHGHAPGSLGWANSVLRTIPGSPEFKRPEADRPIDVLRSDIEVAICSDNPWQQFAIDFIDLINSSFESREIRIDSDLSRCLNAATLENASRLLTHMEAGNIRVKKFADSDVVLRSDSRFQLPDGETFSAAVLAMGRDVPPVETALLRCPRIHALGVENSRRFPITNGVHIISDSAVDAAETIHRRHRALASN